IEAERHPGIGRPGDRGAELGAVLDRERELEPVERTLDRGLRNLAVSLTRVTVAGREECAVDRNRQKQGGARHELLAVDVAAPAARRSGRMHSRLGWRHAEDAREGPQLDLAPLRIAAGTTLGVEAPVEGELLAL